MKAENEVENMLKHLKECYGFKGISEHFKDELYALGQALEWVLEDNNSNNGKVMNDGLCES